MKGERGKGEGGPVIAHGERGRGSRKEGGGEGEENGNDGDEGEDTASGGAEGEGTSRPKSIF